MPTDRIVRFTEQFFDRLDSLLDEERSGDGAPSVTDFLVFDLPPIRDRLACDMEGETLPTDDPAVRVYVGLGILVRYVAVFARLANDGAVEAFWLSLDVR